jgi:hypothetical protein
MTHEGEENDQIYNLLLDTLEKLKTASMLKKLRLTFVTDLLIATGFWPEGKILDSPDEKLEEVMERQIYSERVGKRVMQD